MGSFVGRRGWVIRFVVGSFRRDWSVRFINGKKLFRNVNVKVI